MRAAAETENLPLDHISPDSRLLEDLGLDSLALAEFFIRLEEQFDLSLPDDVLQAAFTDSPVTIRNVAKFIHERWSSEAADRSARAEWTAAREPMAAVEDVPFTQQGGRLSEAEWRAGALYEPMGPNREGYPQFRRLTDGMRCVLLPAAEIQIGSDAPEAAADQRPAHMVSLGGFLMDAEPVSNAAYARFLNSVGDVPPDILAEWCGVTKDDKRLGQFALTRGRKGWEPWPGTERQPMILASWFGANAYALWAHRQGWRDYRAEGDMADGYLPSEAQWEYAARGPAAAQGGSAPDMATATVARHQIGASYRAETLPAANVSERRGMSLFGLHHMAGNVWQWCRDWYAPDFYQRPEASGSDPQNVEPTGIRSERGGSWVGPARLAAPTYRRGRPPYARGRCLGFRCAGPPAVE